MKALVPVLAALLLLSPGALIAQDSQSKTPPSSSKTKPPSLRVDGYRPPGGFVSVGHPAWKMTDEERIGRRVARDEAGGHVRSEGAQTGYTEKIEGREHPELFFSFELFDRLLKGVSTDPLLRNNAHSTYDPKLRALGYNIDIFWATLSSTAQPYLEAQEANHHKLGSTEFTTSTGKRFFVPISEDQCRTRFAALQELRQRFGGEDFDRVLYSVVAPEASLVSGGNVSPADRAEQLRFMAGGCK